MQRDETVRQYINTGRAASLGWRALFFEVWAKENLTAPLADVLTVVKNKQPISGRQIAEEIGITRGAVAQFVEALFRLGLVERNSDTSDRRISYVTLTEEGITKVNRIEKARNELAREVTGGISDIELQRVTELNHKILQNLEKTREGRAYESSNHKAQEDTKG
jgi:DNA-binding MarR family transcriptional regulator